VTPPPVAGGFPTGFRRRLALAFVVVAGVAAGSLAIGAAMAVTSYRHHAFRDRAREEATKDLARLDASSPVSSLVRKLEGTEQLGGPDLMVIEDGAVTASVDRLDTDDVPSRLRSQVRAGGDELVAATTTIDDGPFYVLGRSIGGGAEVYFFFSQGDLRHGLTELRVTLVLGWAIVVVGAAVAGTLVARRTLRPVQAAADAARSVTEGLLATRLRVEGDDEFALWAQSFNEMVGALEEKIVALEEAGERERRFNADVAHELRTPLGTLVTAATLVEEQERDLPAHLQRPMQLILDGVRRMHRLVDELLELHRLEAGQEVVDGAELDLATVVCEAVALHGWEDEVVVDVRARPLLRTDRRRVDRIVVNLVGNALDHGGGDVVVEVDQGAQAVVAVRDHGPGIAPDALPRLFDRYFKVSPSRPSRREAAGSTGSGLGLAIAAEQAKLLGGSIDVESVPGEGSTFTLRLPVGSG
jgi:two-component system sensor histidine kinase MtrB